MKKTYAYHKPGAAAVAKIAALRQAFSDLHELLEANVVSSRERSVALTHLEDAAMWAIKAVVCNDPESEVDPDSKPKAASLTGPTPAPVLGTLTTDRNDPRLRETQPNGQNAAYIVLSEEERAKGFVRPVRRSYKHVGCRPKYPTRPLDPETEAHHIKFGYVCFEAYPEHSPEGLEGKSGRFWMKSQLESGCGTVTTMGQAIAETYARDPKFYGSTFCCGCGKHLPVGPDGEFVWEPDGTRVGS